MFEIIFGKKKNAVSQDVQDLTGCSSIENLVAENARLRKLLDDHDRSKNSAAGRAQLEATIIERNFWVEQCREMQNQLQHMHGQLANAFRVIELNKPMDDDLLDLVSQTQQTLKKPVIGVEAARAAFSMISGNCQGQYTAVNAGGGDDIEKLVNQNDR